MKWREYENKIHEYVAHHYINSKILYNQTVSGKMSGSDRQIDMLIDESIAGRHYRIVIDYSTFRDNRIDVRDVETFLGTLADCEAQKGILITAKGFTQEAMNRAQFDENKEIEVDLLNIDDLNELTGSNAIIYKEDCGAIITTPFGWIIDKANDHLYFLAAFYKRGIELLTAVKNKEWICASIEVKSPTTKSLKDFLACQEEYTKKEMPDAVTNYEKRKIDKDKSITFREISHKEFDHREITGFVEFDEFIFYAVLITSKGLYEKNFRKLEFILDKVLPLNMK